ncbi:MAG: 1-acyl-sn-glycerol-3-phosphate acyltransferase [Catenulispora sp.]|nr:1-acyl-sn-glycerol-3-phosphate acyltransferase [Catenulispora sp.]
MRTAGRRLLGIGLLLAASALVLVATGGALVFTAFTAPWRPSRVRLGRLRRVLAVAVVYATLEIKGLTVAIGRWIRFRLDHDAARDRRGRVRSLRASLADLRRAAGRFGGLDVVLVDASGRRRGELPDLPAGPVIVCGRHGGVGGAFLLAHLLLSGFGRVPRVVLKQTLAWDPLIDTLLSRIPHAFIDPQPGDGGATADRIGALAGGMAADEALLIFPEGGNFTPRRRMRAIGRLRRRGLTAAARRAARLRNVLPPHPDGVFAAIEAAPEAAVVFVAHTGLDHLLSAADVWRALPLRLPVLITWWAVPAGDVPGEPDRRLAWLEDHWARIDAWVARNRIPL